MKDKENRKITQSKKSYNRKKLPKPQPPKEKGNEQSTI